MLKNIVLSFLLICLSLSGLDATCLDQEDGEQSRVTKTSRVAPPYPITREYTQKLLLESLKKVIDIFDDNIKVGAGGSEARLQFKLLTGYVTTEQLAESAAYKKTGKLVLDIAGNNITNTFRFSSLENMTQASGLEFTGFKRPGYIASSSGLCEKAFGTLLTNCIITPSSKTLCQETGKFFKTQLVAIGIAAAGHYYHTNGYQAPDYITDEFFLASHMAVGGAFAHFAGTILVDLSKYYMALALNHPLMTPEGFYEAARAQEKRLKDVAYKTQKIIKNTRDNMIEHAMPKASIPSGMTRTDLLKAAAYNATLQITYEFGAHLGEMIHTINTFGSLANKENNSERQETREYFGSVAAYFSKAMMNGCGIILSNLTS